MEKGKAPAATSFKSFGPQKALSKGKGSVSGSKTAKEDSDIKHLIFGTQQLVILPENSEKGFKTLRNCPVSLEQQVLLDALYRASTPTAKLNALNALNYFFSKMQPQISKTESPKTYVLYKGERPGVYRNYGLLQKAIGNFEKPSFKGFPTLNEALHSAASFFDETTAMSDLSSYCDSLGFLNTLKTEEEQVVPEVIRTNLNHYKRMNRILNGSNANLRRENQYLKKQLKELQEEISQYQTMMNYCESYERFSWKMQLSVLTRKTFLLALPEEVRALIYYKSEENLVNDLKVIQDFIWECKTKVYFPQHMNFVQYQPGFTEESLFPIKAKVVNNGTIDEGLIKELFFNGFLHEYRGSKTPEFLGTKAKNIIDQWFDSIWPYGVRPWICLSIFSTSPQMKQGEFTPAKHHIIISQYGEDMMSEYNFPSKFPQLTAETFQNTREYDNFPHENDIRSEIQLIGETSLITVWASKTHPNPRLHYGSITESIPDCHEDSDEDVIEQLDALMNE